MVGRRVSNAVNALLSFVQEHHCHILRRDSDEIRRLQVLDAEVFAACSESDIPIPKTRLDGKLKSFGLTGVPIRCPGGIQVYATDAWQQGMRGILAFADTLPPTGVRAKRSTKKGDARLKLIAALTKHHKYADDGCLNLEPIVSNELARKAGVSKSTASTFFKSQFGGCAKYRARCRDATDLVTSLKVLNQEFAPHHLFGAQRPDEVERDDQD
jgi:hypothetical protein